MITEPEGNTLVIFATNKLIMLKVPKYCYEFDGGRRNKQLMNQKILANDDTFYYCSIRDDIKILCGALS